jgi:hypothetical protein
VVSGKSLEIKGKPSLSVLRAAQAAGATGSDGEYQIQGELLFHKRTSRLGRLFSTSYGFALSLGGSVHRVKLGPLEIIDTLAQEWPNLAPFDRDNHWTLRPTFLLTAKQGDEEATARLVITYPAVRQATVTCNSNNPKSGPYLFASTISLSPSLEKASLKDVKMVNWLRTGDHIEDGGLTLYAPGTFDNGDGRVELGWDKVKETMTLKIDWAGEHSLEVQQDEQERGETYAGKFSLKTLDQTHSFSVQCRLQRNY